MKIKITYLVSELRRSGPINVLLNIIKNVDKELFNVSIITLSQESNDSLENEFTKRKIPIYKLNTSRVGSLLIGPYKLKAQLQHIKPDIIHTHSFRADLFLRFINIDIPKVTTVHSFLKKDSKLNNGFLLGSIMYPINLSNLKRIDYPIACSKSIKDYFEHIIPHMSFIRNGINLEIFNPDKPKLRNNFEEWNNFKYIFISVGHLSKRKNPLQIIKAFINSKRVHDSLLIFLGDGPQRNLCMAQASEINNIIFEGRVNNVEEFLLHSDCFISASLSEGLPNSVIEALASGLYLILSDIPPHSEIVNMDPSNGSLFNSNNISTLVKILDNFQSKPLGIDRIKRYSLVKKELSAYNMGALYQQLYFDVIKNTPPNK
ncbi:glycosyltransferase [uncultured Draconibacterium sp.]|uniref:glycosyltransferase n=1 Tax=uncultured Draconibacterium sp. TaxID=1573823 RepID=UPI0032179399